MLYAVAMEVDDWKAQVIVAPYQLAISDVKRGKSLWLKVAHAGQPLFEGFSVVRSALSASGGL